MTAPSPSAAERILVTGGAGFIGSAVARFLIEETGAAVLVYDKLTYAGRKENLETVSGSPRFSMVVGDVADPAQVASVLDEFQPTAIMHLAAESHVDRSISDASSFIATNIVGTHVLLDASLRYWRGLETAAAARFRFLHISTDEVFGSLGLEGAFTETTPYDPRSPYSASKASSDHLVRAWWHTYGLPTLISNCSNNYGPYHFPEKLIPLIILNALDGRRLPIYGAGDNVRDWLYVEDHARALVTILESGLPGESYYVGGRNERTNLQVVHAICDRLDQARPRAAGSYRDLIDFVTDRPGHDKRYAIDASKLERELGWRARETFETGVARTIEWYLANEAWWRPLREIYDGQRLGLDVAPSSGAPSSGGGEGRR